MKSIPLTQGKIAIVDDDDFDSLNRVKWQADKGRNSETRWYAARTQQRNGKKIKIRMHRQVMGFPSMGIDHKNGNGLDNRKSNLRIATKSQNLANSKEARNNSSGYKGVSFDGRKKLWRARIMVRGHAISLGRSKDILKAVDRYREAANHYFGEFARAA